MGPRDWFETIKEVVKKIGNTGDTGGSQTAGTVFAKENTALEILESFQNGNLPIVKSVQRGTATYNRTRLSISITTINPNKSLAILNEGSAMADNGGIFISGLNENSLIVDSNLGISGLFSWQVIEFC